MDIESAYEPFAGEGFHFTVSGGVKPVRIRVYIDRVQVLDDDCPDPPCHEMVLVPHGTRGSELWVIATDALGTMTERRFSVGDSDTNAGGMTAAGG